MRYKLKLGHHAKRDEYIQTIFVEVNSDIEIETGDYFSIEEIDEK